MTKLKPYADYKKSGIGWLPEVPTGWQVGRIKSRVRLVTDRAEDRTNPVALENIEGWTGRLVESTTEFAAEGIKFEAGDVLFGKLRPYLAKSWTADRAGEAVGDLFVMRPGLGLNPKFLNYMTLSPEFISMVDGSTFGSKMPRASWDFIANVLHPFPDPEVQALIVSFLDRETAQIDELIGKQERLIKMLAEKRQAIITHAVTKGLDPTTPTKPSGVPWLGEVPQDWVVCRLKDLLAPSRGALRAGPFGSALTSEDMEGNFAKVFNQATVIRQDALHGDKAVDERKFAELVAFETFPGDLLVTTRGTIGRAFVLPQGAPRGILHPCLIRMQLSPAQIDTSFLAMLMNETTLMRDQFDLASNATTIGVIYTATLANIVIALPPLEQQHEILLEIEIQASKLGRLRDKAVAMVRLLRERRSALISAAVTGKIDVREGAA